MAKISLLVLALLTYDCIGAATQDIANERQQLAPHFYEDHWGISCDSLTDRSKQAAQAPANQLESLIREANLCAQLYSAVGAPFPKKCPDFILIQQALANKTPLPDHPSCQ